MAGIGKSDAAADIVTAGSANEHLSAEGQATAPGTGGGGAAGLSSEPTTDTPVSSGEGAARSDPAANSPAMADPSRSSAPATADAGADMILAAVALSSSPTQPMQLPLILAGAEAQSGSDGASAVLGSGEGTPPQPAPLPAYGLADGVVKDTQGTVHVDAIWRGPDDQPVPQVRATDGIHEPVQRVLVGSARAVGEVTGARLSTGRTPGEPKNSDGPSSPPDGAVGASGPQPTNDAGHSPASTSSTAHIGSRGGTNVTTSPAHLPAQIARVAAELGEGRTAGMRLRLDPPSLGEVRVQIEATGRGIEVRIVAQTGQACALLSDRQSQLRDELWRSGITLHSFSASVTSERVPAPVRVAGRPGGEPEFGSKSIGSDAARQCRTVGRPPRVCTGVPDAGGLDVRA